MNEVQESKNVANVICVRSLVPAVDLEEGGPLLALRRRRPQEDFRGLLLVHHHVVQVEPAAQLEVPIYICDGLVRKIPNSFSH